MRVTNKNNLFFQKILKANCKVIKDKKQQNVSIYQLEPQKDSSYFDDKFKKNPIWDTGIFMYSIQSAISDPLDNEYIYVIEDESNKNCIGYCITSEEKKKINIDYIESMPKDLSHYRYVGETLLTFLAKKAKSENKSKLTVNGMAFDAANFYTRNCFFIRSKENNQRADLYKKYFELLEWRNESHTGDCFNYLT